MKNKSPISTLWRRINFIIAGITFLAYLTPLVSPDVIGWVVFIGYFIPPLILLNLLLVIYWINRRNKLVYLPLLTLVIGWTYISRSIQVNLNNAPDNTDFKVLSYNCRYFNMGDREKPKNKDGVTTILENLLKIDAGVVCFQEYYNNPGSDFSNTKQRMIEEGFVDYHLANINISNSNNAGLAIFTKYPIIKKGIISFQNKRNNKAIYADVQTAGGIVRIFNVHFASLNWEGNGPKSDGTKDLFKKIKSAAVLRAKEVDRVKDEVINAPYPVLLVGDFNDTPYSYAYQEFSSMLNNTFEQAGNGFGFTYQGKIPGLRIDHQFVDRSIEVNSHQVQKHINYTDHFPILATYKIE